MQLSSTSEADTLSIGRRLAALLRPGDIILLSGRLGSGKTLFTSGIAEGLGVTDRVVSPSFVLVRRYSGFLELVHADAYRLGSMAEFEDLDLEPLGDAVLVVEWGDAVRSGLPDDHLLVRIDVEEAGDRTFDFIRVGTWQDRSLDVLTS
jgi:tRNA threonylcarbamoyladenosine biosynthesis protein TsaE